MNIGFHASIAGGLVNAPLEASALGCTTFQIFSKSPRSWAAGAFSEEEIKLFKEAIVEKKIYPVVVHTSYLINLASEEKLLLEKSIKAFALEINRAEDIGADYITTHIGSCGDCDKNDRFPVILKSIQEAVKLSGTSKVGVLFENSGRKASPGGEFKDLAFLVKKCGNRFGITLDTCHAFVAGYDVRVKKVLDECIAEAESIAGAGVIKVIHLNDSKGELGSGLDRHEHLGKGEIGKKGIAETINHPKLKGLPFILETPKEPEGADKRNIAFARAVGKVGKESTKYEVQGTK